MAHVLPWRKLWNFALHKSKQWECWDTTRTHAHTRKHYCGWRSRSFQEWILATKPAFKKSNAMQSFVSTMSMMYLTRNEGVQLPLGSHVRLPRELAIHHGLKGASRQTQQSAHPPLLQRSTLHNVGTQTPHLLSEFSSNLCLSTQPTSHWQPHLTLVRSCVTNGPLVQSSMRQNASQANC